MAAVYESLTPGARRELPVRYCEPFKVEGTQEAQTIPEGAPMHHDCGLDQADLGEIAIPGYRIGVGVEENAVSAEAEPG
jgi:hypothetical protein